MNQTLLRSLLSALNEKAGKDGCSDVGAAWSAFEKNITCALYTAASSACAFLLGASFRQLGQMTNCLESLCELGIGQVTGRSVVIIPLQNLQATL